MKIEQNPLNPNFSAATTVEAPPALTTGVQTPCCSQMTDNDLRYAAEHGGGLYAAELAKGFHFSPNS
jgi:hypothetical protein